MAGGHALQWRYEVIRLWQLQAEDLLQLGQPALTVLVGQTQMTNLEAVASAAVAQIGAVSDPAERASLINLLKSLSDNKEFTTMVKKMTEKDWFFELDTPYLREIRAEGEVSTLRRNILQIITVRFAPSEAEQQALAARLAVMAEVSRLDELFTVAVQADSLAAFQAMLGADDDSTAV